MAARTVPGRQDLASSELFPDFSEKDAGTEPSSGASADVQHLSPFQKLKAKLSTSGSRRHQQSSSNGSGNNADVGVDEDLPEELTGSRPYRQPTILRRDRAAPPPPPVPPKTHPTGEATGPATGDGGGDPYAALRAATPPQGWDADGMPSQGAPASVGPGEAADVQPPLPVPGGRTRLSWHGDTRREPGSSSSRALRSTLSALRLNSWAGDSEYHPDGSSHCSPDLAQLASPTFTVNSMTLFPSLAEAAEPPRLSAAESYALLLTFQSQSFSEGSSQPSTEQPSTIGHASASVDHTALTHHTWNTEQDVNGKPISEATEWHEIVDVELVLALGKDERRRQGVWWEVIRGERAYVRDLGTMIHGFMEQLLHHEPPIIDPPERLQAFTMEVFSTAQAIYQAHAALLENLMKRQRDEWPLFGSATDLFLGTMLECAELYEVYMKNYPFAKSRIRREEGRNPQFRDFVHGHTALIHAKRRDIFAFLLRPCHRLTSLQMQLKRILKSTPADHPDKEELPTLLAVMHRAVQSSQPGIASAESKLQLWNVAERLLLRRGETVEMGLAEPKRSLVHEGRVYRRTRGETAWHGWQDIHAILLDNYLLLTRDIENGKHVIISRPIPLDLLVITSTDGAPERRTDLNVLRRTSGANEQTVVGHTASSGTDGFAHVPKANGRSGSSEGANGHAHGQSERLMFPFTISTVGSVPNRTYTLCTHTEEARREWVGKLQESQTLRQIDMESNRQWQHFFERTLIIKAFTVHTISRPRGLRGDVNTAETFEWLGRQGVAIASGRSVWLGWRRDAGTFRECVRLAPDGIAPITSVTMIPDFGYLLVLCAGRLLAYNLRDLLPSPDPDTWVTHDQKAGRMLGDIEKAVTFVRVGYCKERLLVVYACHSKTAQATFLIAEEPLVASHSASQTHSAPFRRYATTSIPGHATDISFYRHTLAVVTDKQIVIVEPGNPTCSFMPSPLEEQAHGVDVARLVGQSKSRALGMFQVQEHEFVLVWDWGACFVNRNGDLTRNGNYLRWNVVPSYVSFRQPSSVLLHDEAGGVVEVRDVISGALMEIVQYPGLTPIRQSRTDGDMLCRSSTGLAQIVETVEL